MKPLSIEALAEAVARGDRASVGRAITLVESKRESDVPHAQALLTRLMPLAGKAMRVGFTGVPGAGKSTLLELLGTTLCDRGHHVAVVAVDPSSVMSGGSILGDKTRMTKLARHENAFVRPASSSGALGGVAPRTRDAMTVLEAAGYDVIFVETVGVGQSETSVRDLVDSFVWLTIPNAGDELQGIKRGVLELVEVIVVHKADGDREVAAKRAARELSNAFHYLQRTHAEWETPVLLASSYEGRGIEELWETIRRHHALMETSGELSKRRSRQATRAMWTELERSFLAWIHADPKLRAHVQKLEVEVAAHQKTAGMAALEVRRAMHMVAI